MTTCRLAQMARELNFPVQARGSVKSHAEESKRGCMFGRVLNFGESRFTLSKKTIDPKFLPLLVELNRWARRKFPDFKYGSIQFNVGGSALHVDQMNLGPSILLAFGDFHGGELWTMAQPNSSLNVRTGKMMDGNIPHITLPFEGERFSAVFFNMKGRWKGLSPRENFVLEQLGFPLPSGDMGEGSPSAKCDLPLAAFILRYRFALSAPQIGDWSLRHEVSEKWAEKRRLSQS